MSEPPAPTRAVEPEMAGIWATEPGAPGSGDTETVEQASIFPESGKAEAESGLDGDETPIESREEDPLTGFFFGGKPGGADDVFLDEDTGGKSKPRDFEW